MDLLERYTLGHKRGLRTVQGSRTALMAGLEHSSGQTNGYGHSHCTSRGDGGMHDPRMSPNRELQSHGTVKSPAVPPHHSHATPITLPCRDLAASPSIPTWLRDFIQLFLQALGWVLLLSATPSVRQQDLAEYHV